MSRYYSYETIRDNAKDVTLENGVKHRCIDPDALLDIEPADVVELDKAKKEIDYWHDKAQIYEQRLLKLSFDVVEEDKRAEA